MQTNRQGFTLVEVIVVAVIVAILASIGIPLYNGYINDTKQDAVESLAETVAASANAYWRKTNSALSTGDEVSVLKMHYDQNTYSVSFSGDSVQVSRDDGKFSTAVAYKQ